MTSPRWAGDRSTSADTNDWSRTWGTVIFTCFTSADWQLVEGNRRWDIQSGTKPVHWKRLINDPTSLWMPEVWNTSAPPVRGAAAATPTGPGSWRQLGECSSTRLYRRHATRLGYVEVGVEIRIDAGVIWITRVCLGAAKCTLRP
jgi:hypothetical protein